MSNSNDCVTLSDDDNLIQASEERINRKRKNNTHPKHKKMKSIETIVLDDEISNNIENNNVIELPDSQELLDKNLQKLDKIHQEDQIFSDFVEKCLNLENSDGMIRIINKTVLKAYEECDKEYRKSPKFQRFLLKTINRLETDPDHKFSHVKVLVETLKLHKLKKRVQLTTLATNLKENGTQLNNGFSTKTKISSSIIIDSDDEQKDVPIPTINLDDYQNDIIEVLDEEKENHGEENRSLPNSQESFLVPQIEVSWNPSNISASTVNLVNQVLPIEYEPPPAVNTEKDEKIKAIFDQIIWCKEQVTRLDEAEVVDDSATSPYILCEKYKAQIVQLYKQACQLTGDEPVKRRKVRLQVREGHPPGPVKRLETFINDNIGEDGIPLFPDFFDVVKCVMVASIEDKMGWNKQQVMREANFLFTQCGLALQKKRQRREYRDLLSRVKVERPEQEPADPAEHDPELQRKLEENRKIAVYKENDLLDKYVKLQNQPTQKKPGPSLQNVPNEQTPHINGYSNHENTHLNNFTANKQPTASSNLENNTVEDSRLSSNIQNNVIENQEPGPQNLVSDEDSDFEPPEVRLSQETDKTENKDTKVKIKEEPLDIVQMLADLGDDYTTTVIDIEDPFLVIEISSDDDSSDDEMLVEGESD